MSESSGESSAALLLLEYERSSEFTNHVDDVRNVITSFFITLVAGLAVTLSKYSDGSLKDGRIGTAAGLMSAVCGAVFLIGILFVMTVARLRRVQRQRYGIMNAILDRILDPSDRDVVPFGLNGPKGVSSWLPVRLTGSYLWTLILILPTGLIAALGMWIWLADVLHIGRGASLSLALTSFVAAVSMMDQTYVRLSRTPAEAGGVSG